MAEAPAPGGRGALVRVRVHLPAPAVQCSVPKSQALGVFSVRLCQMTEAQKAEPLSSGHTVEAARGHVSAISSPQAEGSWLLLGAPEMGGQCLLLGGGCSHRHPR